MKTNLTSEQLMLGVVDMYKKVLFCDSNDIFMESLEQNINSIADADVKNKDKLKEINNFGLRTIQIYGKRLEKKVDNLNN